MQKYEFINFGNKIHVPNTNKNIYFDCESIFELQLIYRSTTQITRLQRPSGSELQYGV